MKKALLVGGLILGAMVAPAWADSTHVCQGNSCNEGTNNHIEGSVISNPSATSTATSNANSAAVSTSGATSQSKSSATGGNATGGSATASYEGYTGQGQSQSVTVDGTKFDRYAPPAYAPGLTSAGTGVCLGSVSIGASGPMAGLSFGITKVDKGCELRSNAALLFQFGYRDAAVRLLMKNDDVREAMGEEKVSFRVVTPEDHINVRRFPAQEPVQGGN